MNLISLSLFNKSRVGRTQFGAISLVETLVVLMIGLTVLTVWASSKYSEMEVQNARAAGRVIAQYTRAASTWLAENPPNASGVYDITQLQNCLDPNGARFLSCSYNANTSIPHAHADSGDILHLGDISINVVLSPNGAIGTIDFGVFRSGRDGNGDGMPDSRIDLAAAALQTASEETAAGVLDFFEINFAEANPANIVTDSKDPSFDQDNYDNLARLQAIFGSIPNTAPFLMLDGSNEMTGGIRFENGMQINMNLQDLVFEGSGDLEVQTDTGQLTVSGQVQANELSSSRANIDRLNVNPLDGVTGDGFNRFNQAPDITRIDGNITKLDARISQNKTDIDSNKREITENRRRIGTNTTNLSLTDSRVATNTSDISLNRKEIAENRENIKQNSIAINKISNFTSFEICTPTWDQVINNNPGVRSCGSCFWNCGYYRSTQTTYTYKTRNETSLRCSSHQVTLHTDCCLVFNGNCDGYCANAETHC